MSRLSCLLIFLLCFQIMLPPYTVPASLDDLGLTILTQTHVVGPYALLLSCDTSRMCFPTLPKCAAHKS